MQPINPHSKWYHCLCCMQPKANVPENQADETNGIQASPAGHWNDGVFQPGAPTPTDKFKKEFEGK